MRRKRERLSINDPYPLEPAQIEGLKKLGFGELYEKFYRIEALEVEKYVKLDKIVIFLSPTGQAHKTTQRQLRGKYFVIEE